MKMNWNKIIAGALITSSITREVNAINFNYNPNLEKSFEVRENSDYYNNFVEIQSPITPITLKDAVCVRGCEEGWVAAMAACAALANPLLIVGCQVGASLGLAACIALCP